MAVSPLISNNSKMFDQIQCSVVLKDETVFYLEVYHLVLLWSSFFFYLIDIVLNKVTTFVIFAFLLLWLHFSHFEISLDTSHFQRATKTKTSI